MKVDELGALQLDGLREVANIGAGHAATALSQLTNRRIMMDVPVARIVALEQVGDLTGDPEQAVGAVAMRVFGDAKGRVVQVFPARTATRLAEILLQREDIAFPDDFGEMEQSALKEAGNIVTGAYLSALSDFLGMLLLPSVPELALDMAAAVLESTHLASGETDTVLCLDTRLRLEEEQPLRAHFMLLPAAGSLNAILRAIRLA